MKKDLKKMPPLTSDKAAEEFIDKADLTEYDLSEFQPMYFEIEPKSASINIRLPKSLLKAIKNKAQSKGIPYTRYIRMLLETDINIKN